MQRAGERWGSTLVEAVVAIAVITTGVVSLCGLVSVSARTVTITRDKTMAAVLASQKLETLAAARWASARSSAEAESPGDVGVEEHLDATGGVVGSGTAAGRIVYVRRWSVSPLHADGALALIQVAVSTCRRVSAGAPACGDGTVTVRLATIRSSAAW